MIPREDNVVRLSLIPRPRPSHVSLVENRDREKSKAAVQQMTDKFCADTWRGNKLADAQLWCDRALSHPLGGPQWVLSALEKLRSYVENRSK